ALLWRTQRTSLHFRRIEEIEFADGETDTDDNFQTHEQESKSDEIDFILDGQQRITSIYKLFPASLTPSEHDLESRFKGLRFFLALEKLGIPQKLTDLRRTEADFVPFSDPDVVAGAIVEKRHSDLRKEYRQVTGERAPQRLSEENILRLC